MNENLVVIPTYNEAGNIAPFLAEVRQAVPSLAILVVDDSSPDGTAEIVKRTRGFGTNLHLLSRQKKDGLAGAYIAGFEWALANGYRKIGQMDADFSHPPGRISAFLDALDHADAAVGTRYSKGSGIVGWPWYRLFISRGGNVYAKLVLSLPYADLTGGFNFWTRDVLAKMDLGSIKSKGYAFQIELKFRAHRLSAKIAEIPFVFEERREGQSKMSGEIFFEAAARVLKIRRDGFTGRGKNKSKLV